VKQRRDRKPAPEDSLLEEIGGEPLAGSGFEDEEPEPGFTPARQNPGPV